MIKEKKSTHIHENSYRGLRKVVKINNFTCILEQSRENVYGFVIMVRVGSAFDKVAGTAHLLEHCVFNEDHTKRPTKAEQLAMFPGALNAHTGREVTRYYCDSTEEHIIKKASMLANCVLNPKFTKGDFHKEHKIVTNEVKMYNDQPEELVSEFLISKTFGKSFGAPIAGHLHRLPKISYETVSDFFSSYYNYRNIVISLSGNESISDLENRLIAIMEKVECNKTHYLQSFFKKKKVTTKQICLYKSTKSTQAYISMCYDLGSYENLHQMAVARMATKCLGSGFGSLLVEKVREEKGLCYSISAHLIEHRSKNILLIECNTGEQTLVKAYDAIKQAISHAKVTEDNHKRVLQNTFYGLNKREANSLSISLDNSLIYHLFSKNISPDEIKRNIESVTLGDITSFIYKLSDKAPVSVVIGGNKKVKETFEENFVKKS